MGTRVSSGGGGYVGVGIGVAVGGTGVARGDWNGTNVGVRVGDGVSVGEGVSVGNAVGVGVHVAVAGKEVAVGDAVTVTSIAASTMFLTCGEMASSLVCCTHPDVNNNNRDSVKINVVLYLVAKILNFFPLLTGENSAFVMTLK